MKEVFGAAPGKGFIRWLLPEGFEELDCLAMGEDIEKAQKFSMDAIQMRPDVDKAADRNVLLTGSRSRIVLAILLHFGTSSVIQEQVRIIIA